MVQYIGQFSFPENLQELMDKKNLTQLALAESIGVSQKCVSKWLNGRSEPTLSNIVNLCRFFDVSSDFLIGLKVDLY